MQVFYKWFENAFQSINTWYKRKPSVYLSFSQCKPTNYNKRLKVIPSQLIDQKNTIKTDGI